MKERKPLKFRRSFANPDKVRRFAEHYLAVKRKREKNKGRNYGDAT